ncbi:hypothetical protein DT594_16265 [Halopseudomonas laoshanensis]|uniref:Integrase catalytic domain-containing protein n=1 Tax=Halopseudomonas laoshanensis TaxID=2268758 RepID=A0A7V7KU02_9GAMM|nr:DDE-type integrase/transposase/recombinase [Halopseudomonas laoshanensis]KAA0691793.1 hypothetical protein DT594_16265 [Halopseudomonas laoshanensis]WOD11773.1 DDE-type integrase/transposase/recombinase [Pseudomonas sp. NyZ704]
MLTEIEMLHYQSISFNLSRNAKQYIQNTRESEASRMVGTHAISNLVSWRVSSKINRSVSIESRSAETAFFILSEYDSRVLELWDQPEPRKVERHDKNGRKIRCQYNPDFLLLTTDGPLVVEVKTSESIDELVSRYPSDWVRRSNGVVGYLPAETAFSEIGIRFEVFVYSTDMAYQVANTELMLQARSSPPVPAHVRAKVVSALEEQFAWTLDELRRAVGLDTFAPLVKLIDEGEIVADLRGALLSEAEGCVVARDSRLLREGRELLKAGQVTGPVSQRSVSITRVPTLRDAEHALKRLSDLEDGPQNRSTRRSKKTVSDGAVCGLSPFQSLLPKYYQSGNRRRRLGREVEEFLAQYLSGEHANSAGLSKYRSYVRYRVMAAEVHPGLDPVSQKTFDTRLGQMPARYAALKRGGKRAANAVADPTDPEKRVLRSRLPWERAAIDHYLADIYVVVYSSDGTVYVERPWVTAMIDLYSSYVLAITISFLSPSSRAVSKIFRECVRLHRRLPAEVIVDRGAEFRSTYMASLTAHYGITYTLRPASHPRFGSQVERFFGEFKQQWLSQRPGNLADYKEARSVDGKCAPKKRAIMFPARAFEELKAFCNWRNGKLRGGELVAADTEFKRRQALYPFVAREINYDLEFMMMTAVDYKAFKVDQTRGIHVGTDWYYAPELASVRGRKSSLQVRLDPENPHVVYACINQRWVTCESTGMRVYNVKSGSQQLGEGLVKLETYGLKNKIRMMDDEDLCRIIRSYSVDVGAPVEPAVSVDFEQHEDAPLDLDSLLSESIDDLEVDSWSASYD